MFRLLRVAGAALLLLLVVLGYLIRFQGLRVELDGSGSWPVFSFYKPDQHLAAIEQNRASNPVQPAAVQTIPSNPVTEAPPKEPEPVEPRKPASKPYWTDYRGPRRDGVYAETPIVSTWPGAGPVRAWRKPVGGGYASYVIANGKAFTIEQRRNQEVVAAYNLADGTEVWSHAWNALFQETMGGDGPRATPTWNDGRIYALGAEGELRCLDAETGRRIWAKNILEDNNAQNLQWGMAGSPLVIDNQVIVLPGGRDEKSVVAYDKVTGVPLWKALSDKAAYASPMLVKLAGEDHIVVVTATRVVGLTKQGKLLWEHPWVTANDINVAQPIKLAEDRLFLSAGYGHGAAVIQVAKSGDGYSVKEIWQNTRMKNKFTSSVAYQGHIYGFDEAILACVDAETGELKWKGGRYGYGQTLLAGGQLIVITEDGEVAIVRATPEKHDEVARFSAVDGKTWNTPAIGEGLLLVRNAVEMTAFRVRP